MQGTAGRLFLPLTMWKIAVLPDIKDACSAFTKDTNMATSYAFAFSLSTVIKKIDVSAIGLHPSAFIGKDGKPDVDKI
jgi:hypothetical protein